MASSEWTLTHVGGPTLLVEGYGLRLLTDPTFDPAGTDYANGPVRLRKLAAPALSPDEIGAVDAVLLSHDQHEDNLDHAGRAFLDRATTVLTTRAGAARLEARGLDPWESVPLSTEVEVVATPARHGPEGIEPVSGAVTGFFVRPFATPDDSLWLTGDTVAFAGTAEVAARLRPRIFVPFVGAAGLDEMPGVRLTMDAAEAASLAVSLGSEAVAPIHAEGWAHWRETWPEIEAAFAARGISDRLVRLPAGRPWRPSTA